ncbi:MAG: transglutaminase-like domain-containing protein [Planctomycetaceae bacterium]
MTIRPLLQSLLLLSCVCGFIDESRADDTALQHALGEAGANRLQLEDALEKVPVDEKAGMRFLIENMPTRDLKTLSAEFLLENSRLAWLALRERPWAKEIPKDVIHDALLPYASVSETRDRWRARFHEQFSPLIKDCKTPTEAAAILNQQVFPLVKVKYSTQRRRADQSPLESIETGLASCTGLSILLIDACRSVGIPARLVGTPLWSDNSGNHTWVEIWDKGWHFTGACEPTGNKLNEGWFIDRASKARTDHKLHAIYAVTFKKNGHAFPMVWARDAQDVNAVNVSDRYIALRTPIPEGHGALRIRVRNNMGRRVAVDVSVQDGSGGLLYSGPTKDDRFDSNDHLTVPVLLGSTITIRIGPRVITTQIPADKKEILVDLQNDTQ